MQINTYRSLSLVAGSLLGIWMAPAAAQSSVTIYGVVDMGIARTSGGGETRTEMEGRGILAGNRLGFKGVEDLGNGLKALYVLEWHTTPDIGTSNDPIKSRQTWGGLQGPWGTLTAGFQYAPGFATARFDVMRGSGLFSARGPLTNVGNYTINPGNAARWANTVRYGSPNFSGFSFEGLYSTRRDDNEGVGDRSSNDSWAVGLGYKNGPGEIGLVHHDVAATSTNPDARETFIGGSWDFRVVKAMATWQRKDAAGPIKTNDNQLWSAGAEIPVGSASAIHVGYAALKVRGRDNDSNSLTIGATHDLSKRTTLYAVLNRMHHDDLAPKRTANLRAQLVDPGEAANTWAVGISHKF